MPNILPIWTQEKTCYVDGVITNSKYVLFFWNMINFILNWFFYNANYYDYLYVMYLYDGFFFETTTVYCIVLFIYILQILYQDQSEFEISITSQYGWIFVIIILTLKILWMAGISWKWKYIEWDDERFTK